MESNALTEALKDAICAYSTSDMWYYKVKGDHDNPNSLERTLNINYGQLLTFLKCVGLARPDGRVSQVFGTLDKYTVDCMYSFCRKECGTMTNADLVLAGDTITQFSNLWRSSGMLVTPKAHTIEKHLMSFIRRFCGLRNDEFIERAHQDGIANEKQAANTKELRRRQCILHFGIGWGKIRLCRKKSNEWWEDNRRKRKHGDTRDAAAMANKSAKMQVKEKEGQQLLKSILCRG